LIAKSSATADPFLRDPDGAHRRPDEADADRGNALDDDLSVRAAGRPMTLDGAMAPTICTVAGYRAWRSSPYACSGPLGQSKKRPVVPDSETIDLPTVSRALEAALGSIVRREAPSRGFGRVLSPGAKVALQRGKEPPAISNRMRLPAVNRCVTASSSSRTTSSLTNQIPLPAQPAGRRVRFNELGSACAVAYGQASAFGSGSSNSYSSRPIRALLPATAVLTANDGQHLLCI
jgi:hypothetical protein